MTDFFSGAADDERAADDDHRDLSADEAAAILGGPAETEAPTDDEADLSALFGARPADDTAVVADEVDDDETDVVDADDLLEEEAAQRPPRESPADRPGSWYVLHTQSGYEKKVKSNLENRINSMNMEESIFEVVIPMEDVIEFKGGKKVVVQKKVFPGYLYVRCFLDDHSWDVIRNTPGVTGFVGTAGKPIPLTRRDVEQALSVPEEDEGDTGGPAKRQRPRLEYQLGEIVRVRTGPFADFSGQIAEINEDQLKVKAPG